jgi:Arc/MetJ-type ribon-helix-helix transcriptional regulator
MELRLPPEVQAEVEDLVALGEYADAHEAVVALVREGLGYRYRRTPTPTMPVERREPPGPKGPHVPDDVNWIP